MRSSFVHTTVYLLFVQWFLFILCYGSSTVVGQHHHHHPLKQLQRQQGHLITNTALNDTQNLVCVPFGTCEPCPDDALHEPFCQPFGNRRLMHCFPATSTSTTSPSPTNHPPHPPQTEPHTPLNSPHSLDPHTPPLSSSLDNPHQGEIPAWESCGRIPSKERADFYEFLLCNVIIALLAMFVVFARSKRLQAMQARQLAARIGLVRGTPGGWVNG